MKFGVNTFIWGAAFGPPLFGLLPRIKESGFDGIEFPILDPRAFAAASVRQELDRMDLARTACGIVPGGTSLGSPDASERSKAMDHLRACIDAGAEAGITTFSGPFYTPVGYLPGRRRTADEWKRVVESWQELAPAAESAGVEIGLEPLNRFETYFLNTIEDAVRLCDEIRHPSVGILLDTFHANIEEKSIGAAVRRAAPHLKHLHTCENDRGTPGSGHVSWDEFFSAVSAAGYDRWMTIESFGFSLGEMSAAAAIWRDIERTPDDIAFDGIRFLRSRATGTADTRRS